MTVIGLVIAAAAALIGIVTFTWAANPAESGPPSMRHADLVGVDLSGSNLDGVDLTGADLTGADLHGASLDKAELKDVTWKGTTCPDGVLSTDVARPERGLAETCLGHLGPA